MRASRSSSAAFGNRGGEGVGDFVVAGSQLVGVGEGEDRPERRGDHLLVCLGDEGEQVAGVVDPAALPRRPRQDLADRGSQPGVGVGDDEAHPAQPAGAQRAQEPGPERLVLAVADVDTEDLAVAARR